MSGLKFSKDHEWVSVTGDVATVGITQFAQEQLGDVVFVELPTVGKTLTQGGEAAVVESVKAASDVFAPISGEVVEVNTGLEAEPAQVNQDPEGAGWFMKIKIAKAAELDELMDAGAYKAFTEEQH